MCKSMMHTTIVILAPVSSRPPECVPWYAEEGDSPLARSSRPSRTTCKLSCGADRHCVSAAGIRGGHRPLITTASLKTQSWKDLADMAKSKGLSGWHSMRKEELVKALVRAAKEARAAAGLPSRSREGPPSLHNSSRRNDQDHSQPRAHAGPCQRPQSNGAKANGKHAVNGKSDACNGEAAVNGKPLCQGQRQVTRSQSKASPPPMTAKQLRIAERIHRVNVERERLKDLSGAFTLAKMQTESA